MHRPGPAEQWLKQRRQSLQLAQTASRLDRGNGLVNHPQCALTIPPRVTRARSEVEYLLGSEAVPSLRGVKVEAGASAHRENVSPASNRGKLRFRQRADLTVGAPKLALRRRKEGGHLDHDVTMADLVQQQS